MAQLVECPTLELSSGLDLRFVSWSPAVAGHGAHLKKKKKKTSGTLPKRNCLNWKACPSCPFFFSPFRCLEYKQDDGTPTVFDHKGEFVNASHILGQGLIKSLYTLWVISGLYSLLFFLVFLWATRNEVSPTIALACNLERSFRWSCRQWELRWTCWVWGDWGS